MSKESTPGRKAWASPVLEQLTIDLDAIANGSGTSNDAQKMGKNNAAS